MNHKKTEMKGKYKRKEKRDGGETFYFDLPMSFVHVRQQKPGQCENKHKHILRSVEYSRCVFLMRCGAQDTRYMRMRDMRFAFHCCDDKYFGDEDISHNEKCYITTTRAYIHYTALTDTRLRPTAE